MKPPLPPKPTDARDFKPPVAWLLGPQVIASLRSIGLFTLFGSKMDARDWMLSMPETFEAPQGVTEFWFDYLADTGDGQMATYSIAYLCLTDLEIKGQVEVGASVKPPLLGPTPGATPLPRGELLVVGGDTAYHVATWATLAERVQNPFRWAAESLSINDESPRRPIFGLPGNHDYYDSIDGFNRQFRRPLRGNEVPAGARGSPPTPPLRLPGFERRQTASYFDLELPFGWRFWAVDNELGKVDVRQQDFFRAKGVPDKLIVATPEPSTVLGCRADEQHKVSRAFHRLGLPRPFLEVPGEELAPTQCRLDISGDMHHYARYWGPDPLEQNPQSSDFYASVVAGLGGAFLHPSHVQSTEIRGQALYPPAPKSRVETAKALFNPIAIWRGGFVWAFGGLIAAVAYASTVTEDSRPIVEPLLGYIARPGALDGPGHVFESDPVAVLDPAKTFDSSGLGAALLAIVALAILGHAVHWVRAKLGHGRSEEGSPLVTSVLGVVSLALFGGALFLCPADGRVSIFPAFFRLLAFGWSILAVILAVSHAEWLFKLARKYGISRGDHTPVAALVLLAALVPFVTLNRVGGLIPAARLGSDTIIITVLLGVAIGLVFLGATASDKRVDWKGRVGWLLMGLWHAGSQLGLPLFLARLGSVASLVAAACLTLVFGEIGKRLSLGGKRWWLLLAWLAYGVAVTLCATLLPALVPFAIPVPAGYPAYATGILAAALGAVMSCVSLGWYFAVAVEFSGHVNVAGGAARIEKFKQFIRFCITEESLTGYVIAIDDPKPEGRDLDPRLVDVFTVKSRAAKPRQPA